MWEALRRTRGAREPLSLPQLHGFSRQRYGTKTCPAERLPADKLEAAVLAALLETYSRSDLITEALVAAAERSAILARHSAELGSVESEGLRRQSRNA
jgi:hypothetical protein